MKYRRTILALFVVLVVATLLNLDSPTLDPDHGNIDEYAFWLNVQSAIRYFVAVTIGAIVARRSFIGPALALAASLWLIVTYVLFDIGRAAESVTFLDVAKGQFDGLILLEIAALLGALLGRWFYKHEIERSTTTT